MQINIKRQTHCARQKSNSKYSEEEQKVRMEKERNFAYKNSNDKIKQKMTVQLFFLSFKVLFKTSYTKYCHTVWFIIHIPWKRL